MQRRGFAGAQFHDINAKPDIDLGAVEFFAEQAGNMGRVAGGRGRAQADQQDFSIHPVEVEFGPAQALAMGIELFA